MRGRRATFGAVWGGIAIFWLWGPMGCSTPGPAPWPAMPFELSREARILIVESQRGLQGLSVRPFRRDLDLGERSVVAPPAIPKTVFRFDSLAKALADAVPVEMVFIVSAETATESAYNPAPVPGRVATGQLRAGNGPGPPEMVPVLEPAWEIEYRNRCRRIAYRIRIYGGDGRPKGETLVTSAAFQPCPSFGEKDVLYDDIEYAAAWFKTHLQTSP